MSSDFTIKPVSWSENKQSLSYIRHQVFIDEQDVPEELEWDEFDQISIHLLARDSKQAPIGCARLLTNGKIGRMAVLKSWRGKGVGTALLKRAIQLAEQQGHLAVELDAQSYVIPFYQREGFIVTSTEFTDAGIPHHRMKLTLKTSQ